MGKLLYYLKIVIDSMFFRYLIVTTVAVMIITLSIVSVIIVYPQDDISEEAGIYYINSEGKKIHGDHLKEQSILYDKNDRPIWVLPGKEKAKKGK